MLASYDLPDVAVAIAPLPLAILDAVDSEKKRFPLTKCGRFMRGAFGSMKRLERSRSGDRDGPQ